MAIFHSTIAIFISIMAIFYSTIGIFNSTIDIFCRNIPIVESIFGHPTLLFRGTFWEVGGT